MENTSLSIDWKGENIFMEGEQKGIEYVWIRSPEGIFYFFRVIANKFWVIFKKCSLSAPFMWFQAELKTQGVAVPVLLKHRSPAMS